MRRQNQLESPLQAAEKAPLSEERTVRSISMAAVDPIERVTFD